MPVSRISAWVRAVRAEYMPFVVLMFGAGAAAGALEARAFDLPRAFFACASLLLIHVAAALTNEHFDYPGDIVNRSPGRFSGGSRTLVTGAMTHDAVVRGAAIAIAALGAASGLLLALTPHALRMPTLALLVLGLALGLGYSAPPVRLCQRSLGEISAAFGLGVFPALTGWVTQGGTRTDPLPWLIAMPAFCALLAFRTLAGIPDIRADEAVRRRTYAVVFGPRGAAGIAAAAAIAASLGGILLWQDRIVSGWYGAVYLATVPHALWLAGTALAVVRRPESARPMDGVLLNGLLFALWFGLIPFACFARLVRG